MDQQTPSQLSQTDRETLLEIAASSIRHGLKHGTPLAVAGSHYPAELQAVRACFVTLQIRGVLRGCIGHLEAQMPIVEDVAENAFSAAFRDPRFPPLSTSEFNDLEIHISVLTPAEPLQFDSEEDLIGKIRPAIDGLILVDGQHRGTFLPSVWESLPDTRSFLYHLKQKAGLPGEYWSDSLEIYHYETESFS
ncbi:MAG: AmmeMemoRadiSam system protein A [Candidatus Thiodiazotropha sp. (ex Cardiolucina cf. quadrata)]|nr:AmmeMemoRadiSam system protein A [Candidatus Thiodiazotropha sp. (ex Cardiolucina cf. quadrata)]